MSVAVPIVPDGAVCAGHPESAATWVCRRCGSFMCGACERRTRPEAPPMCPGCWALREKSVPIQKHPTVTLQTAGLVLGISCILPILPLMIGSLIVNIVGLVKAKEGPARAVRRRSMIGLVLTVLWMGVWGALFLTTVS